jgi:broad specificity phosphatase PhoE
LAYDRSGVLATSLRKLGSCFFYRHAATEYNERNLISGQRDIDLSHEGKSQALLLRSTIPADFDLIVCSGLKRTWQTMSIALNDSYALPSFYIDRRINEVSLGVLEGKQRRPIDAFAMGDIDYRPPHGETYRHAAQRAFSFLVDLLNFDPKRPLVFTHAGIMRIFATLVFPTYTAKEMFSLNFTNTFSMRLSASELNLPKFWLM